MVTRGTVDYFNKNDNESDFVVLEIPRSCIETGYLATTLEKLHALTDSKERIEKFRDSVAFSVTGYDSDPRELCQIPEVRQFFQAVTQEWPHWLWFLNRSSGLLRTLMMMLCDVSHHSSESGRISFSVSDAEVATKLEDMLFRGEALFDLNDIDRKAKQDSLTSAMKDLGLM